MRIRHRQPQPIPVPSHLIPTSSHPISSRIHTSPTVTTIRSCPIPNSSPPHPHPISPHSIQNAYITDSYNHQIRRVALTDVEEADYTPPDTFVEIAGKIVTHNLMLILIVVVSSLLCCGCTLLVCRVCFLCPLYQRKLHAQRIATMQWGDRV